MDGGAPAGHVSGRRSVLHGIAGKAACRGPGPACARGPAAAASRAATADRSRPATASVPRRRYAVGTPTVAGRRSPTHRRRPHDDTPPEHDPRPGRRAGRRPHHQHRADRSRAGACAVAPRGRRRGLHRYRCAGGAGHGARRRRRARRGQRAVAAGGTAGVDQGSVRRSGPGDGRRLARAGAPERRDLGRNRRGAAARGRRGAARPHQHERIRVLGPGPEPALRHAAHAGGRHARRGRSRPPAAR